MKQFQDAFAPLHAPRDLPGRVLARAERPRPGHGGWPAGGGNADLPQPEPGPRKRAPRC